MTTVTLLLTHDGQVRAVYADREQAEKHRDRYNDDPFLEPDLPDPDAPYKTETWSVRE